MGGAGPPPKVPCLLAEGPCLSGGSCFALHHKAVTFSAVPTTAVALIATLQGFLLLVVGEVRAGRYGHLVLCEGSGLAPVTGARPAWSSRLGGSFLEYVAEFAAAGIYLRGSGARWSDPGRVVGSEEVAQTLADPLPDLIGVGSRVVLQPDGERVICGLHDLIAAYTSGFLNHGGYRHG